MAALNVLHYDNRADPGAFRAAIRDFAWQTIFDAAALRAETGSGWTAILQWLDGKTIIDPGFWLEWTFDSRSALLAKRHGPHMLAMRYDDFEVHFRQATTPGNEDGHAWTVAYSFDRGNRWRFMLEWIQVRSNVAARPVALGEPALATESKVELSARYAVGGIL